MTEISTTFGDGESITEAIIDAVCELEDAEPEKPDYVLYDWIDPDALDTVITSASSRRASVEVGFFLADYHVTVRADRTLTVRSTRSGTAPASTRQETAQEI